MQSNLVSGGLCMDLCIYKTTYLDSCMVLPDDSKSKYRFFSISNSDTIETTIVCSSENIHENNKNLENFYAKPHENTTLHEFEQMMIKLIEKKLGYMPPILDLIDYLIDFADINRDEKLSLPEARSLWSLLNNNHTFYMLVLHKHHYIPQILRYCGDLIETDELISTYLYSIEYDSILPSLFPNSYKWSWPKWEHRVKIVISILEFYFDMISFNPNDEFGKNTLYLCSPIETSFGHTYYYDAKLLNYEYLITAEQLEKILNERRCTYDTDCMYTSSCITKCDQSTHKCTSHLAEPQITHLCRFLKVYLFDDNTGHNTSNNTYETLFNNVNSKESKQFNKLLKRCFKLSNITKSNFMSFTENFYNTRSAHGIVDEQRIIDSSTTASINAFNNLTYSLEYSTLVNDLRALLWSFIKYTKDPVKPKKLHGTTTSSSSSTSSSTSSTK